MVSGGPRPGRDLSRAKLPTAVYRSELASEVRRLSYRLEITNPDGRWELHGYTREQVMAFSRRRQDIEAAMVRERLNGAAAAQNIAHRIRLAKDGHEQESLKGEWRERAPSTGSTWHSRSHMRSELQICA